MKKDIVEESIKYVSQKAYEYLWPYDALKDKGHIILVEHWQSDILSDYSVSLRISYQRIIFHLQIEGLLFNYVPDKEPVCTWIVLFFQIW